MTVDTGGGGDDDDADDDDDDDDIGRVRVRGATCIWPLLPRGGTHHNVPGAGRGGIPCRVVQR